MAVIDARVKAAALRKDSLQKAGMKLGLIGFVLVKVEVVVCFRNPLL
jgi:hypothetical protein